MLGGIMNKNNDGVSWLSQTNQSWLSDGENKKYYFTEKHKLLILKRNLEHNAFHTGVTLKIKRREK